VHDVGSPLKANNSAQTEVFESEFLGRSVVGNRWARRPEQIGYLVGLEHAGGHAGDGDRSEIERLISSGETAS